MHGAVEVQPSYTPVTPPLVDPVIPLHGSPVTPGDSRSCSPVVGGPADKFCPCVLVGGGPTNQCSPLGGGATDVPPEQSTEESCSCCWHPAWTRPAQTHSRSHLDNPASTILCLYQTVWQAENSTLETSNPIKSHCIDHIFCNYNSQCFFFFAVFCLRVKATEEVSAWHFQRANIKRR